MRYAQCMLALEMQLLRKRRDTDVLCRDMCSSFDLPDSLDMDSLEHKDISLFSVPFLARSERLNGVHQEWLSFQERIIVVFDP